MLVLTRNIGEVIVVDENIEFVILETRGRQVKVGVTAPKDISIHRSEIQEKINNEKKELEND